MANEDFVCVFSSEKRANIAVYPLDVFVLTDKGTAPLPDVVVLDVMLPDVNGFEILKRMKAHPVLKAIPVIMLTAEAKRGSVRRV